MDPTEPRYPRLHLDSEPRNRRIGQMPFSSSAALRELVESTLARSRALEPQLPASPNPCALQPDTLAFLQALVERVVPQSIVEFGSGQSTVRLAQWVATASHGARLTSIEHDSHWFEQIWSHLSEEQRSVTDLRYRPLRLTRSGLRVFLTYERLEELATELRRAELVLLDGPHISGREPVLYLALSVCASGAVIVMDDYRLYAVREMLASVPDWVTQNFVGAAIDENSHGLYVLQCSRPVGSLSPPNKDVLSIARSYWRCWRDFREYGTGRSA